jgi:1-acyl-sn-glycerol-3-phosphate acyltransferase
MEDRSSRGELIVRSLLFSVGYVVSTLVFAIPSVLTYPLPFRQRYAFISQWARFNLWWLRVTCRVQYEVQGLEHIPATPCIIFCNHQSAWETLALQKIFPPQVWLMKRELLWIPFFGWGLAMLDPIAIDRRAGTRALRQLIEQGAQRLATGRWVVIFPEGTRVAPGAQRAFQVGGAKLAEHSGAPVIPVAHNAGCFWPRRSFVKMPGVIRVVIGAPITTAGRKASAINADAEAWIGEQKARLLAGLR